MLRIFLTFLAACAHEKRCQEMRNYPHCGWLARAGFLLAERMGATNTIVFAPAEGAVRRLWSCSVRLEKRHFVAFQAHGPSYKRLSTLSTLSTLSMLSVLSIFQCSCGFLHGKVLNSVQKRAPYTQSKVLKDGEKA